MKKFFLLLSIFGMFISNFFSQDIIYTKSQTEIKAKVLEITTDAIKYKEYDFIDGPTRNIAKSNVFMIEYSNGKKEFISKNDTKVENITNKRDDSKNINTSGYRLITEIGYNAIYEQMGNGTYFNLRGLKINIINGYNFKNKFYGGISTGVMINDEVEEICVPIAGEFRFNFKPKSKVSPFLSSAVGYTLNTGILRDYDPYNYPYNLSKGVGLLFDLSIGASFQIGEKNFSNISVGYEFQRINYDDYSLYGIYRESTQGSTQGLLFEIGFIF